MRSSETVWLTLSSTFGRVEDNVTYYLAIEEGPDKDTFLFVGSNPLERVSVSGMSILSETDFVDMWLKMTDDGVHFGVGTVDEDTILHLNQSSNSAIPVSGIMFLSNNDDTEWVVSKEMGR